MIKNYDFVFEGSPDDVGMQTGATIHTVNGLKMKASKVSKDDPLPQTDGWWEKQHLKRGLTANGKPFQSIEDVASQNVPKPERPDDPGNECP
jgi:hypothetical protein